MTAKFNLSRRKVRPIPKGRQVGIEREEYNRLIDLLNERGRLLNQLLLHQQQILQEQRIQFQRISQIQVELDQLKQAVARLRSEL
jgi:hypothetical protein